MTNSNQLNSPEWIRQQEMRNRCFHPSGLQVDFSEKEITGSIPARFERQVVQNADRIAFTEETVALTYQELNVEANLIANAILAAGGVDNEPVVALMDEGVERVSAFLGILKTGKCYVGVSPELPFDRLQFMVEQSMAQIILVQNKYRDLALRLAGKDLKVVEIEADTVEASQENPDITVEPDQRCWLVYTSGSTGKPKGVIQTHQNMLHDMRTNVDSFHLSPEDRLSTLMSLTTSGGCFGALMALGNGATLCRIDVKGKGVEHMASEIARHELTVWGGVPSLFRQWMVSDLPQYPHLRLVWFGGEAVHARDFELYRKHLSPSCLFVNRLGSTETCCTRMYFADHDTRVSGSTVPVGYPVRGQDIILEDAEGRLVKEPGSGEMVVHSFYLSPGYWKRPDLTQLAYRSVDETDLRSYRTGDLGQLDADGCLTYLGRKDFQVQIRGFRVEVAEVETILDHLDTVREVVVTGLPLQEGGHELAAYVVPSQRPGPTISVLRGELAEQLPDYMIPSRFIYLDRLPRAGNGKILRGQLSAQSQIEAPTGTPWQAPRTSLEKQIANIWEEVLNSNDGPDSEQEFRHIGVHDDFFDLGGHSLQATQIIARFRNNLLVNVPLRTLFDMPTVAEQAIEIDRLVAESE